MQGKPTPDAIKKYLLVFFKIAEQLGCDDLEKAKTIAKGILGVEDFDEKDCTDDSMEHLRNCSACLQAGGLVHSVCEIHASRLAEHHQNIKTFFDRLTGKDISDYEASI